MSMILLTMTALLSASAQRVASYSTDAAGWQQRDYETLTRLDDAMQTASDGSFWLTSFHPPQVRIGSEHITVAIQALGTSATLPHPAFQPARHTHLEAHWFRITAVAERHALTIASQQRIVALITTRGAAPMRPGDRRALTTTQPSHGMVIPVSWAWLSE
ncbi:MAG: hypothetical protein AAGA84_09310 [Pseudomonadota bacterium]